MTSDPLLTSYIRCGPETSDGSNMHYTPAEGCLRKSQFTLPEDICATCSTWIKQLKGEDLKKLITKKCPACGEETIIRKADETPICQSCLERL